MLFDKINLRLAEEEASFTPWKKHDVNPLGRTQKSRILHTPNESMGELHRTFVKNLRRLNVDLSSSTCGPGGSSLANVILHRDDRWFYVTDISSAFDSVERTRLAEVLVGLDPKISPGTMLSFLTRFCFTNEGGLITGSPSSPDLFNIYCAITLDLPMREYTEERSVLYSRYLDDLTFSSLESIGTKKRERIRAIVAQAGFRIGHHKSRVYDLKKAPIEINGIGLEFGGRTYLPRWYLRKIRGMIRIAWRTRNQWLFHKIHGMIGLLTSSTDRSQELNEIEARTYKEYKQLRDAMANLRKGLPAKLGTSSQQGNNASLGSDFVDEDLDDLPF